MYEHFIITRYCLGQSAEWAEKRERMFFDAYVPSLASQVEQNFKALLLVSAGALDSGKLHKLQSQVPDNVRFIEYPSTQDQLLVRSRLLLPYLREQTDKPYFLTSRVDSDDAISKTYVGGLHVAVENYIERELPHVEFEGAVFEFQYGVVWRNNQHFQVRYSGNPFLSLLQSRDAPQTCYIHPHSEMPRHFRTVKLSSNPAWLIVAHPESYSRSTGKVHYSARCETQSNIAKLFDIKLPLDKVEAVR